MLVFFLCFLINSPQLIASTGKIYLCTCIFIIFIFQLKSFFYIAGIFEGGIGIIVYGAITLVLWYGGKLVHEHAKDPNTGISPGIFTGIILMIILFYK